MKKTRSLLLVLGGIVAIAPFSIDMYLPGFPAIARDLNTDIPTVALSLTSYFIGIGVGQIIYGPVIDRFGRKRPLVFGFSLYLVAAIACALAPTVEFLIAMRVLLALGGCVGMVASRAIVRDTFPIREIPRIFSFLMLIMGVAPIVAPTLGGYFTAQLGWRSIFVFLTLYCIFMLVVIHRALPESRKPDPSRSLRPRNIAREYKKVFFHPVFRLYSFAGSFSMSGMFAYIAGSPFVYMEILGLTDTQYGWAFGINAMGLISGSQLNREVLKKWTSNTITLIASTSQLLAVAIVLGIVLSGGPHEGIFIGVWLALFFQGFINPNTTANSLAPFTRNAGSASALSGSMAMLIGAFSSYMVSFFFNETAIPMVGVMVASAALSWGSIILARRLPDHLLENSEKE